MVLIREKNTWGNSLSIGSLLAIIMVVGLAVCPKGIVGQTSYGAFLTLVPVPTGPGPIASDAWTMPGWSFAGTANFTSNTYTWIPLKPNGNIGTVMTWSTVFDPRCMKIFIFKNGGIPNILTGSSFNNTAQIFAGSMSWSFTPGTPFTVPGSGLFACKTADVNGDGKSDLTFLNFGSHDVVSMFGNGDGTFKTPVSLTVGVNPTSIALYPRLGKINLAISLSNSFKDGRSEVGPGSLVIFPGNGDGTYQSPMTFPLPGSSPTAIESGDFNGDGNVDLAVTDSAAGNVAILLGKGDGTFQPGVTYPVGSFPVDVKVADFNGDGKLDLVVANFNSNNISILYGKGDGTFQPALNIPVGTNPSSVAVGDFNGDGRPDMIVSNFGSNNATILLNTTNCPPSTAFQSSVPDGGQGQPYNQTVASSTATSPPFEFVQTSGNLPTGVTFSSNGTLSGTPTTAGTFNFTVIALIANGCPAVQTFALNVHGNSIALNVPTGGANTSLTSGSTGPVQAGYAVDTVNLSKSSESNVVQVNIPYGTAVFSFAENGIVESEAGVPASPPTTSARIFIDYRTAVPTKRDESEVGGTTTNTGFAAVNMGTATANVTYTLRDNRGNVLVIGHGMIPKGAHRSKFISQLNDIASDFVLPGSFPTVTQFATLEITSDQPLSILALRLTNNQRGDTLLTSTPIADLTKPLLTGILYFPQLVDGDGYKTTYVLLNTSSSTETGTLRIFKDDGTPLVVTQVGGSSGSSFAYSIPPGGFFGFETDGSPSSVSAGSVQVTPDLGTSTPVGAGLFKLKQAGILVTESGIPSAVPTVHARIYVDESGGHDTGLAIASPSGTALNVTVNAFQKDGVTPAGANMGPVLLNGNGHTAKFAGQLVSGLPTNFTGVMDIASAAPFVALTLRSLSNARGDFLLTTFPIADFNQNAPFPIVFPQIADGGGFRTQFILLSAGGTATTTLKFFGDDGSPLGLAKTGGDR